jgi:diaminobutyrate-2-oxoglutarate transaminase
LNFESLSYEEAPLIKGDIPGPKTKKILQKQREIEGNAVSYSRGIPIALDEGRGATVKDVDGNIFIDLFAGAGVVACGHCNPVILEAVKTQQNKITHTLDFPTKVRMELIEKIREIIPEKFRNNIKIQFGGPTGSDAVEMAVKLAKYKTKRYPLIAFEGSYHGMTSGAVTLTSGKSWKTHYLPMLPEVHFVPYAYCYRCPLNKKILDCDIDCAKYYEHVLVDPHSGVDTPAATLIEAIQGEGGTIVPPNQFTKDISKISHENEVPIVFDEIQAGFCRTGEFFSFQHSDATPDIITMSKAIGGGFPLSAIVYQDDFDVWEPGAHIGTFRGNVTAMAAGVASIDFMIEQNLNNHVRSLGSFMIKKLNQIENKTNIIGEVRGRGLMFGVEIVNDKETKAPSDTLASKIRMECYKQGILIEIGGHYNNVVRFLPPLVITKDLARIALEKFEVAIEKAESTKTD